MKLLIPLFAFLALLVHVDRFFLKKNSNFCLHYIQSPLSSHPEWETDAPFPEKILSQPFYYLGKGSQTYVFESQDKKYVLKFYKFPSHMRTFSFIKHPFAYRSSPKRIQTKAYNEEKFKLSYNSYFLAFSQIPETTGVIYTHLNPTAHLKKKITLVDKLGIPYHVSADTLGYVVQKRGSHFFTVLDALLAEHRIEEIKQLILDLFSLIQSRCLKGITDLDDMKHNNYGVLEGKTIHLDIGRFVYNEAVKTPAAIRKEILRVTAALQEYVAKKAPELASIFEELYTSKHEDDL